MAKDLPVDDVSVASAKLATADAGAIDANIGITVLESVDSTNSWCLRESTAGRVLPFLCFARQQTSGRGRRGKQWLMTPGSDIAMSIAWPYAATLSLQLLPLTIALAIAETLQSLNLERVQIKWPNDVYVQGEKIAGILIETQPVRNRPENNQLQETGVKNDEKQLAVVIGIGLNYDMSMYDQAALDTLPSLTDICAQLKSQLSAVKAERDYVATLLQKNVVTACRAYQYGAKENLKKFRTQYDF